MKLKKYNWPSILFIVGYHALMIALIPLFFMTQSLTFGIIASTIALLYATGLSVTAGYHRYFSHQCYKTNKWVEAILLFFGTMAVQGSAIQWSHDHRNHHAFIDGEKDPYSVNKGFWHAHLLWMFKKQPPINPKVVADLIRNPLVMFQHKYYVPLMILTNVLSTVFFGLLFGNFFAAFLFTCLIRLFLLHHFTWFINSLAHYWGHHNYSTEHTAVDNYIISFLTFGEGYHNYHHTFANDYRNGIKWYHFDPTKWLIWTLGKLGLAHNLKTVSETRISKQMIQMHKTELLKKLKITLSDKKVQLESKVGEYTEQLLKKVATMNMLLDRYKSARKEATPCRNAINTVVEEIRVLKKSLKRDWRKWKLLSKEVMKLKDAKTA